MKKFAAILLLILLTAMPTASAKYYSGTAFSVMYHKISDTEKEGAYIVSSKTFAEDIKYLKSMGYTLCTASEFNSMLARGTTEKLVAITFDDGYDSDIEKALPILEKYHAKATFFVIGSLIGTDGYMTPKQIKTMSDSGCVEIANHTHAIHNATPDEARKLYQKEDAFSAFADIIKNKTRLEEITEKPIRAVSYPYGIYNTYFDSLLKKKDIITFCSDEKPVRDTNLPYGRFNRSSDTSIAQIVKKATKQ